MPHEPEEMEEVVDPTPAWANTLKADLLSGLRDVLQQEVQPLKQDVGELKTKVGAIEGTANQALATSLEAKTMVESAMQVALEAKELAQGLPSNTGTSTHSKDIDTKIQAIESQLSKINADDAPKTVVIGGLQLSMGGAMQWIQQILGRAGVTATEIFKMGPPEEEFKGMLFAKFSTSLDASLALKELKIELSKENMWKVYKHRLWVDSQVPVERRACNTFV